MNFLPMNKAPYAVMLAALVLSSLTGCGRKEITVLQRKEAANLASEAQFASTLRDYARAEGLYAKAAELCPDNGEYWVVLGVTRKRLKDNSGAKKAYENAVDAYGDVPPNSTCDVWLDHTVRHTVADWKDRFRGRLTRERLSSRFLADARDLLIWLPPSYSTEPTRRFPVIVLHDGANVFDPSTSPLSQVDWAADEWVSRLALEGVPRHAAVTRPRMILEIHASPDVVLLPLHGSEIAVAAIGHDGDDACGPSLGDGLLREVHRAPHVRAARVPDVEALFAREAIGHVPTVFGRHREDLVGHVRVVDRRHERRRHVLETFETVQRRLMDLVVTPGNGRLARVASQILDALRARGRTPVRVVLDAGAAHNHRELLELADKHPNQVLLVRTPRRPAYRKTWQALPEHLFISYKEPGRYKGAAPKLIHVAETTTPLRAGKNARVRQVRTLVAREEGRSGKDRWHALFVFRDNATPALDLIREFRARQHHEQTYRILLHDAFVDAAPSGYDKRSPNPDRPGFHRNAITLYAWLAGLAVNTLRSFTAALPERFKLAHPRTLRRWWLNFPADLYLSKKVLFVILHPHWQRSWWQQHIQHLNAKKLRVPWLKERLVLFSLDTLPAAESPFDPSEGT